jgi:hypothetical protein
MTRVGNLKTNLKFSRSRWVVNNVNYCLAYMVALHDDTAQIRFPAMLYIYKGINKLEALNQFNI